ncbi:DNA polymerase subunit Cdc27 [Gloeopeniophorella convolvens]|nr:DNA polymerase subunit Cdc27 [Gloeopeniophorella convolvens]
MSFDRTLDYLTEELVVEKNVVTYRSLSRALGIHVNQAKNELAQYHSEHAGTVEGAHATYLIMGEPRVSYLDSIRNTDEMDVESEEVGEVSEEVLETKITLTSEAGLEHSKGQYAQIHSIHIYSLSPSPIREPALVCEPTKALREAENQSSTDSVTLGRITGPHVEKRKNIPKARPAAKASVTASSSRNKLPGLSKPAVKDIKPTIKTEPKDVKPDIKEEVPKPKPSGKLDFSKAKPAESKPKVGARKLQPAEAVPKAATKGDSKPIKQEETEKRLTKRKSRIALSDSEDDVAPPPKKPSPGPAEPKSIARVKKGVIVSDDDEEAAPKPARAKAAYKAKVKPAPPDSDNERELRAMMDVDDDQVTKVSRTVESDAATSPPATDVDMEEPAPEPEPAAKRKPRAKAKAKKEVPLGRNGFKKRRVVKSRMTTDAKGYFVTEDYSSYESVDEEEPPPEKPAKGKGKGKDKAKAAPAKVKEEDEAEEKPAPAKAPVKRAPSLKRKPSKPGAQASAQKGGGITSYFTKKS